MATIAEYFNKERLIMYCTNCGKSLPDDTIFCTECGTRVNQNPAPEQNDVPQPAAPVAPRKPAKPAPAPYQPLERPATPVGKNAYFLKYASAQTRMKAIIAWGLTLVCLIVMLIGYSVTLNTSVERIPIISIFADEDDFDDVKDVMSDGMEELEDLMEENEEEYEETFSKSERKLIDNFLNACKKFSKSFSINNTKKVVKTLDALVSKGIEDELDLDMDIEMFDEIVMVLDTVTTFLLICTLFSVAFSVGGGASRLTPLVAVGLAFSTLNCLIFCGFLIVLLNLAAHITLIVFMTQLNKEYREYRHSYMMA